MLQWLTAGPRRVSPLFAAALMGCAATAVRPTGPQQSGLQPVLVHRFPAPAGKAPAPLTFAGGAVLERDALIVEVLERNPSVDAALQAWKAAAARPAQIALDYPMLSYAVAPLSIGARRVDFGENVEVSQSLPWPGKLRRRREIEVETAAARFQDLEEARIEIALEAARLFGDYYLAARALEINAEHARLLTELKQAASSQYTAGLLSQQDSLKAEVELAHLAHQEVVLETERRLVVARINALLHRAPDAPLPPPPVRWTVMAEADRILQAAASGLQRLEEIAVARRPEVAAAAAEVRARAAALALAHLEAYPDLGIMGSYNSMWGDQEHRWMTGLTLSLPLWRQRIEAAVAEAKAELQAIERRRQALETQVRTRVHQRYQRAVEAHHILELYTTRLLPAALDQRRIARAAVEAGTGSFLVLIEAERALRDAQLGHHEAIRNLDRRLAELAREIGCLPHDLSAVLATAAPSADSQ